jgi:serine/threonine-protein kinase
VREVRLARRITHPDVARTHDIGEWHGHHFLTMELIEGDTLDDLLAARATAGVGVSEAVLVAIQLAEGLQAAHDAGVLHRDLKPANVMVERARAPGARSASTASAGSSSPTSASRGASTPAPTPPA